MTPFRCLTVRVFVVAFLLISLSAILPAQSSDARITGIVTDSSKAIIRGAHVDLINVDTGVRYPAVTNGSGIYTVSGQIGNYRIEVEHVGFKTVIAPGIVLRTQDVLEINFELAVGSASESVTVNAGATNDNPAVSMTVDREFVENMPLNGRSFQDLIRLAPGTVSSQNGYYSIDGQRTDSNNYTVDGVSANLGGFNDNAGQDFGLSGNSPSQTALGTTQSLASIDSLQEFTIQTSGYTAEYGRNPGGQVEFTTRSGTNDMHGSLFEYLRNTAFDANSYQSDYYGYAQTAEHQNDFGGTIGGPIVIPRLYNGKNTTFYFLSYEGLRLLLPSFESKYVPTQAFRNAASPNVQPFLNAVPLPNPNSPGNTDDCTTDGTLNGPACDALFSYGYSYPGNTDNYSVRVDKAVGSKIHTFIRYADTPSFTKTGAEDVYTTGIATHTWTVGLTAPVAHNLIDDFRFNFSHDSEHATYSQRSIGGSVPLQTSLAIPAQYDTSAAAGANVTVYDPGTSLRASYYLGGSLTQQHQFQVVDYLAWTHGRHNVKFGGDWRRLSPTIESVPFLSNINVTTLSDIQAGYATRLSIQAGAPGKPAFDNLSLYVQDHWTVREGLSFDYGLRWEFNPTPGSTNGYYPATLTSADLATAQVAPQGTALYKTYYDKFAPRFGFAWNAIPSKQHPFTVRGGFGIFFDTGQSVVGNSYVNAYPFQAYGPTQSHVPFPLSSSALAPPVLTTPLAPPYPLLIMSSPVLTMPYTESWNLSFDQALNAKNTLTVSYVGNNGRKLLFSQLYLAGPDDNQAFANGLDFTSNASESSYNALQIQDRGRIATGLDIVGSFTYAHALDNASNENTGYSPIWGNSDYDLRRALNLALNYETPAVGSSRWVQALTHGWRLANRFSVQSGYPITGIEQTEVILPNGQYSEYFPDLVPNIPIYLHGRAADYNGEPVPGSWRLNPAAFAAVPIDPNTGNPIRQGTLGRNYVRNPSFWALNTAVQRSFPICEKLRLNFRAEAFNILNHPNLSNPDIYLPDSTFGQLVEGEETTIGSSNALYAMGASRSLQFSLHLQF